MKIDWLDAGIDAYVPAHLGHSTPLGVGGANPIFRIRSFTLRGARIVVA